MTPHLSKEKKCTPYTSFPVSLINYCCAICAYMHGALSLNLNIWIVLIIITAEKSSLFYTQFHHVLYILSFSVVMLNSFCF